MLKKTARRVQHGCIKLNGANKKTEMWPTI